MSDILDITDIEDATETKGKPIGRRARGRGNPKNAWTIKNMPAHQRTDITRAAHRASLNVAAYLWQAHQCLREQTRFPREANLQRNHDPDLGQPIQSRGANLELLDAAIRLIGTPVAKGNGGLASTLRKRILASLDALATTDTRQLILEHGDAERSSD